MSADPERRKRQLANLRRAPSDDPVKRERQLANLRPAPPAPMGNSRRLLHGGRSVRLVADVEVEVRELMDALGDAAPVRDPDGGLPAADVIAVEVGARALKRWRHLSAYNDLHGRIDEKSGALKPAADLELRSEQQLNQALDRLGMNPGARARLGLALARTHRTLEEELAGGRNAWSEAIDGTVSETDDEVGDAGA